MIGFMFAEIIQYKTDTQTLLSSSSMSPSVLASENIFPEFRILNLKLKCHFVNPHRSAAAIIHILTAKENITQDLFPSRIAVIYSLLLLKSFIIEREFFFASLQYKKFLSEKLNQLHVYNYVECDNHDKSIFR